MNRPPMTHPLMNRRYAILSALLRYPDAALRADLADIQATIPQAEFSRPATARLLPPSAAPSKSVA